MWIGEKVKEIDWTLNTVTNYLGMNDVNPFLLELRIFFKAIAVLKAATYL